VRGGGRFVGLLGLGLRARRVTVGVTGVRAGLERGAFACVVMAADASPRTRDKVARSARARGVPVLIGPTAAELGAGLGRPSVQAVGVSDPALARGLTDVCGGVSDDADS
jgi:ribosomal protein L7Ae-like RNA K-turn-binding protein